MSNGAECVAIHKFDQHLNNILHPSQVTAPGDGSYSCCCGIFKTHKDCLHVAYCCKYWNDHVHPILNASQDPTVVPVLGAGQGEARSYLYVCDHPVTGKTGEFVRCMLQLGMVNIKCCSTGHNGQGECWHVREVRDFMERMGQLNEADLHDDATAADVPAAGVDHLTRFHWPPLDSEVAAMNRLVAEPDGVLQDGLCPPAPNDDQHCKCGRPGNYLKHQAGTATVYLDDRLPCRRPIHHFKSSCGKQACQIMYDGHDDGLVAYTPCTIFAASIFYWYGSLFSTGASQESYVKFMNDKLKLTVPGNR